MPILKKQIPGYKISFNVINLFNFKQRRKKIFMRYASSLFLWNHITEKSFWTVNIVAHMAHWIQVIFLLSLWASSYKKRICFFSYYLMTKTWVYNFYFLPWIYVRLYIDDSGKNSIRYYLFRDYIYKED